MAEEYNRKIDIPVKSRISFNDLYPLLKNGKLDEFVELKEERIKKWKNERYRICVDCGKKKLRIMFNGDSKRCKKCSIKKTKNSNNFRKEYHKEYIRKDGLDNWCSKQIVYNLKKMGLIKKEKCIICGNENTFAHHCDYNKPWEVIWLCNYHHKEWHKNNEPKRIKK